MEHVKNTMHIILRSLSPKLTLFNIVGFGWLLSLIILTGLGSTFQQLFENSQEYTESSFMQALEYIDNMSANLGGTKIHPPLAKILSAPLDLDHSKQVFLLTGKY